MKRRGAKVRLEAVYCDRLFTASHAQLEDLGPFVEDLVRPRVLWGQRVGGGAAANIHEVRGDQCRWRCRRR